MDNYRFMIECRKWRRHKRMSQLELALAADISQKHLSHLETGRSKPSREMVIKLSEAMNIPLRDRNQLLQAAGFSASYNESQLHDPAMKPVLNAVNSVLQHHDPFPALVANRYWQAIKLNTAAENLFSSVISVDPRLQQIVAEEGMNIALLTVHEQGLRRYIANWPDVGPLLIRRLKGEADAAVDEKLQKTLHRYIRLAGDIHHANIVTAPLLPVLPLELTLPDIKLSLFSVIATFGTPQDITTDEIKMESFYPADSQTTEFFTKALQVS